MTLSSLLFLQMMDYHLMFTNNSVYTFFRLLHVSVVLCFQFQFNTSSFPSLFLLHLSLSLSLNNSSYFVLLRSSSSYPNLLPLPSPHRCWWRELVVYTVKRWATFVKRRDQNHNEKKEEKKKEKLPRGATLPLISESKNLVSKFFNDLLRF